jgi:spermidine/putrescine transport system substrate-binding protein
MKRFVYLLLSCVCLLATSCKESKKELHLYAWPDYFDPKVIEQFEKESNCRVVVDSFDSNESMYAKLKAGASGYDITFPSNYMFEFLFEQKMIQPLNPALIPNAKNFDENFRQFALVGYENYYLPYIVTFTGLGYNDERVKDMQSSWTVFGREDLKGRMTMLNDVREVLGAALKTLGYSINSTDPSQIDQALQILKAWKKNLAKFESEQYKHGLASSEYLVSQAWAGDISQVSLENEHIRFVLPQEGAIVSCEYMVLLEGSREPELAQAFMNFIYRPEIAAQNMTYTRFLQPNKPAYAFLPEDLRHSEILFPPIETINKSEMIRNIGVDIILYNKAWDALKAD